MIKNKEEVKSNRKLSRQTTIEKFSDDTSSFKLRRTGTSIQDLNELEAENKILRQQKRKLRKEFSKLTAASLDLESKFDSQKSRIEAIAQKHLSDYTSLLQSKAHKQFKERMNQVSVFIMEAVESE